MGDTSFSAAVSEFRLCLSDATPISHANNFHALWQTSGFGVALSRALAATEEAKSETLRKKGIETVAKLSISETGLVAPVQLEFIRRPTDP